MSALLLAVESHKRNQLNFPQKKNVELFMCTVVENLGYKEGFEWLGKII